MNKSGSICLIISLIAVIFTAVFVFFPESNSTEEELTITVMNTNPVTSGTLPAITTITTTTLIEITTTRKNTTTKITTSETMTYFTETFPETETSTVTESVTTSTESIITTQIVETVTEQVTEQIFIDINNADVGELTKLYGIGEAIACEIVNYREQYGEFSNIEEIMNVSGIGEVKFSYIRDYIYVQNPVYYIEEEPEEIPEPEPEPETFPEEEVLTIFPININTAGIEELILLPNVDEQVAQDIINLREQLQKFSNTYELLYVEKLTQKQVAELVEFVTVGE